MTRQHWTDRGARIVTFCAAFYLGGRILFDLWD
jgi:hypothetical protein